VRTVRFDVHAGVVSAYCGGGGLTKELPLGTIRPADRDAFLRSLGFTYPDLRGANLQMSGTAAGVYVDSAVCVVREFAVEALPEP
jgi:hypothetical protein